MTYVFDKQLCADDGRALAEFSSHWAAVAALIRLSDPTFKSLGGDRAEDLAIEARLHFNAERDALGSYTDAIAAIGERVKAGEPVPPCLLSARERRT